MRRGYATLLFLIIRQYGMSHESYMKRSCGEINATLVFPLTRHDVVSQESYKRRGCGE